MMRTWTVNEEQLQEMADTVRLLAAYGPWVESLAGAFAKVLAKIETDANEIEIDTHDEPVSKNQMAFIDQDTSDFLKAQYPSAFPPKDWIDFIGPRDRGMEDGITGVF